MDTWPRVQLQTLYMEPQRNGLNRPTAVRGKGDVRFVNMGELFRFDFIADQPMDLVDVPEKERAGGILREGDLLFARQSLVLEGAGKSSLVCAHQSPMTFDSHLIRIRLDPRGAASRFFYYWFRSPQGRGALESITVQMAAAGIRGSDLARLEVPTPCLSEQHAIAEVLGALDEKIETNRQMNHTLEEMASCLFKSWFVDFDPVVAKAEARVPVGMSSATAELFPASFNNGGPAGWRLLRLREFIDINPKRTLQEGQPATYLEMANAPTSGHAPDDIGMRIPGSGVRFENGDTLIAKITPCLENGKTVFVNFLEPAEVAWGSTEFIVMRPRAPIPTPFAYNLARNPEFRDHAIQSMTGSSGRQRVALGSLERWHMWLPTDPEVFRAFGHVVEPLFEKGGHNARESRTLVALRDALLPKLLSGEIRVADAEKRVEAAL